MPGGIPIHACHATKSPPDPDLKDDEEYGRTQTPTEVLFIGGRSGIGKTLVVAEMIRQLAAARIQNAPPPPDLHQHRQRPGDGQAQRGPRRSRSQSRGLLPGSDEVAARRLKGGRSGSGLDHHVRRSNDAARELESKAPSYVHRVATDHRPVDVIAATTIQLTEWC